MMQLANETARGDFRGLKLATLLMQEAECQIRERVDNNRPSDAPQWSQRSYVFAVRHASGFNVSEGEMVLAVLSEA
jgi:hypothetical protein